MMRAILVLALAALAAAGCSRNKDLGTLMVDVYVHPEAGSAEDILLQTAIRRKLAVEGRASRGVHARVSDGRLVLSGTVATEEARRRAEEIASATRIVIDNESPIAVREVTNLIRVGRQP
jgi:hypothetical protein